MNHIAPPSLPLGRIKTFGPLGPRYEVRGPAMPTADGGWMVLVRLVETGELVEYPLTSLQADPLAA